MRKTTELFRRTLAVKKLLRAAILGFLLLTAFWSPTALAQALIDGFSLDQISFEAEHSGNVPCSEYGHASFAVRQLPGQMQFVQVMAQRPPATGTPAWIVRNVPALGGIPAESTMVDLTQLEVTRGTCIDGSAIAYSITVTDAPLSAAPNFTPGLTAIVGQQIDRAEGSIPVGPLFPGTLAAPTPPVPFTFESGPTQVTERRGMGNVPQGRNECAPSGVANSMHWLQAEGKIDLGGDTPAQSLQKLKSDMKPNGWTGNGASQSETIAGKLRFAQRREHPLDIVIHYQADKTLTDLDASVAVGSGTAIRSGGFRTGKSRNI